MSKLSATSRLLTKLAHLGRDPKRDHGSVNPPVHRTSTILFPDFETFTSHDTGQSHYRSYARSGTISTEALEEALAALEGADHCLTTASGEAAITTVLLAFLGAGDHLLVPDSLYGTARLFVKQDLPRYGVEVEYYDPTIGADIGKLVKPNTKMVYCESPGSLTFEMQDIPAIAQAAKAKNADIIIAADNTWATPLHQRPFELGIDISIHSVSKYIGGHADLVMGAILCKSTHFKPLKRTWINLACSSNADTAFLALRGLRTLPLRLKQHEASALQVAKHLQTLPEVKRVLFPALASDPGHALWKRDMTGACGLFAIELAPCSQTALAAMINGLKLFGIGYSWGAFESLITAYHPAQSRHVTKWEKDTVLVRLHIGLEDPTDLIADLDAGFERLRSTK